MIKIEQLENGWRLKNGNMTLDISRMTGCLSALTVNAAKVFEWTRHEGDVVVRDDRMERSFGHKHLRKVNVESKGDELRIEKIFKDAPWRLLETYHVEDDTVRWEAQLVLEKGEYRSCEISYHIPWPQPLYPMLFWAPREGMPSAPHRFAEISLEYGEITSGILMPVLVSFRPDKDAGLLLAMPFDFKTPRFRFISEYRNPALRASFDWMALSPGKPSRTNLIMRGTGGNWRPALGWLYERYKEYFEPRSKLIDDLWGGHTGGSPAISLKQARIMVELGLRWHEIHGHFPIYGDYHPEGIDKWEPVHPMANWPDVHGISPETVRKTLRNLHKVGTAGLPYIQVSGDGSLRLGPEIVDASKVLDLYGEPIADTNYLGTNYQLNSDLALPFGKDITRQIDGMVKRYPDMDGVFLDQGCYNFVDTAHDDGITAIENRPCYMTGLNYYPHLEHLSRLLHPEKAIIANAPHCIGIMKYIDGFMAEHWGWLCDLLKWYSLSKPMFFFLYHTSDRDIEMMFQRCLVHAAGYTSFPSAMPSKSLYDRYCPLVQRLFRRKWVFDPEPITFPSGFNGNVFRGASGNLLASVVSEVPRLRGRRLGTHSVAVKTADTEEVKRVTLQQPGGRIVPIPFKKDNGAVLFDVPGGIVAAVAELHISGRDARKDR